MLCVTEELPVCVCESQPVSVVHLQALRCADGWQRNSSEVGCLFFCNGTHVRPAGLLWCRLSPAAIDAACSFLLRPAQVWAAASSSACLCSVSVFPAVDQTTLPRETAYLTWKCAINCSPGSAAFKMENHAVETVSGDLKRSPFFLRFVSQQQEKMKRTLLCVMSGPLKSKHTHVISVLLRQRDEHQRTLTTGTTKQLMIHVRHPLPDVRGGRVVPTFVLYADRSQYRPLEWHAVITS